MKDGMPLAVRKAMRKGVAIPAHPLAVTADRRLDERRQRALSRYYIAAGAGGLAVGVHTTQFEIRDPAFGLYEPVLQLAAEVMKREAPADFIRIAGICGRTAQATREAEVARTLGYHAGLLSLTAMKGATDDALIEHCRAVADIIPVMGFYLQPVHWRTGADLRLLASFRRIGRRRRHQDRGVQPVLHAGCRAGRWPIRAGTLTSPSIPATTTTSSWIS